MGRWVVSFALLVACGSSTPPPPPVIQQAAPDAGPPPPLAEGCPATFGEVPAGGACVWDQAPSQCNYPEGSCYCGVAPVCSGAVRPPEEELAQPTSWVCAATPPAIRADGCPGSQPSGACGDKGKRCSYGDCCVSRYVCDGRAWKYDGGECPP